MATLVRAVPASAPRGSGRLPLVLFALLLVVGLLVAADWLGVEVAQNHVSRSVQQQLAVAKPPAVDIHGVPFLTQLMASEFGHVTVAAEAATVDTVSGPLTVDRLVLELHGVHTSVGVDNEVQVDSLTGSAVLGWGAMDGLAGRQGIAFDTVDSQGRGRVRLNVTTNLLGQKMTAVVTAVPLLQEDAQTIELADPRLTVSGVEIPAQVATALVKQLVKPIPLSMPHGLRATALAVAADGATVRLAGTNLRFLS